MMSNEALMKSDEAAEEARDKPGIIIDKDTAYIIHLMPTQFDPQLKLVFGNLDNGEFEVNGVKVTYQDNSLRIKDNIYEFSYGFINFLANKDLLYDEIEEDETIIITFSVHIGYDIGKGDKKSSRYRIIKLILGIEDDVFRKGLNRIDINPNNQRSYQVNDLIQR